MCVRPTGQVQEVEVLYDQGSNRSTSFPEPCGHSREGMGEASAGAHVGRAIERRKKFVVQSAEAFSIAEGNTACTALVRCGRALRRPRTHARMYVRGWDLRGLSAAQRQGRGRQSEGSSRSMDERRREVRCGSISCEADEQSVDDHMAELVERRTAPKGKPQIPARSGHRAGLCVSQGMDRLRLGVACPLSNVMRWHATRGRSRMR